MPIHLTLYQTRQTLCDHILVELYVTHPKYTRIECGTPDNLRLSIEKYVIE